MFRLKDLKNEKLKRSTSRIILYAILEKAYIEQLDTIQVTQTYLADNYCISRQSVQKELQYLKDEGYIDYKRSTIKINNKTYITTEIKLTDKSLQIVNVKETQNKAQISTIYNDCNKNINNDKKVSKKGLKLSVNENKDNVRERDVNKEELKLLFNKLNDIQRDCIKAIIQCKNEKYLRLYVDDARSNNIPEQIISYAISRNK